jgi:ABC-type multidrug transport system ATPase subunit
MHLAVREVRKTYGQVRALDGVTLNMSGGMFGLLGPNGAGKTTLLRILVGLVLPDQGEVRLDGEDVIREPGRRRLRRRLGYLPQEFGFYPEPTAGLDPEERIRVRNLLARLAERRLVILSTHIVEDIGHTCRNLALLADGRVAYAGSVAEFVARAEGAVWELTLPPGVTVPPAWTQVAAVQTSDGIVYRVVGDGAPTVPARPVAPTLEDAYVWHMRATHGARHYR